MDDEFNSNRFKLSNEIGYVSDLNVTTAHGKISEVKFSSNEETNTAEVAKLFENLKEEKIEKDNLIGVDENIEIKMYHTEDKNIMVSVIQHKDKRFQNGQPYCEFSYFDQEAATKNHDFILKRIGKH